MRTPVDEIWETVQLVPIEAKAIHNLQGLCDLFELENQVCFMSKTSINPNIGNS